MTKWMKVIMALVLALVLSCSMALAIAEEAAEAPTWTDADLEYEPNEEFDLYTFVIYELEDMGEDLAVTVSKNEGDTEYFLNFFFFGGDAEIYVNIDENGKYIVTNDSGFFQTDGPEVVKLAEEVGGWKPVSEYVGEEE